MLELFLGHHPGDFLLSLSSMGKKSTSMKDLLDTRLPLPEAGTASGIFKVIMVAVQCLEPNPSRRPTMQHVIHLFSKAEGLGNLDYLHTDIVIPAYYS